jgi:hypothetical protein
MDEPEEPAAPWVEAVVEIAGVVDCAKAAEGAIAAALSVAATGIATIQRERRVKRDAVSRMEEFPLFFSRPSYRHLDDLFRRFPSSGKITSQNASASSIQLCYFFTGINNTQLKFKLTFSLSCVTHRKGVRQK